MARQFGIITTVSGVTSIVINSVSLQQSVETAEARDETGKVTDVQAYSRKQTYSIKGVLDATELDVGAGDTITVGGKTYLIESADINQSNTAFADASITATLSDDATVHPYVAGSGAKGEQS